MAIAQTKYALVHESGSVTILSCVDRFGTVGLEQFVEAVKDKDRVLSATQIDENHVPNMRGPYRDAMTFDGEKFGHDIEKAKNIHRDVLREARKPFLEVLDLESMQALERGEDTTAIIAKKQKLRDAPADPRIDAAKTIDDLKKIVL